MTEEERQRMLKRFLTSLLEPDEILDPEDLENYHPDEVRSGFQTSVFSGQNM